MKVTQTIQSTTEASITPLVSMSKSLATPKLPSFQNNTGELMTTIEQLLALAKSYQLEFSGKIYNDFWLNHNRFMFYFVNQDADSTRWFILRVQNEYPNAKVEFKNYRSYAPAGVIVISFKK